jgi:hypothetical protein
MSGTDTLDSVQSSLVAQSVGQKTNSAVDWMIYKGNLPDGPDRAICLYEYPGGPPLEAWAIDYPNVQVVGRGKADDYTALRTKMQDVFNALHANEGPLDNASDTGFVFFYAVGSAPISLGMDEKRRIRVALNFRAMRNRPS